MSHNVIVFERVCCPSCLGNLLRQYGLALRIGRDVSANDAFCEFCG